MLKFLHTADIHLDSPLRSLALRDKDLQMQIRVAGRDVLRKITNIALEEQVAAVLLAGDVFDGARRSAQTLAFLRAELERLHEASIPVFYVKGNHDAINPLFDMMDWPPNTHIFSSRGESFRLNRNAPDGRPVYLHGASFSGKTAPNLLDKYPLPVADAVNIGLMHTSLNGGQDDAYAPCSAAQLAAHGYDYWALGHIHKRSVSRESGSLIIMPGCPQGRDIGEDGLKSVTLLELGIDGQLREKQRISGMVGFFREELILSGAEDIEDVRAAIDICLRRFRAECAAQQAVLRLRLSGATPLYWQLKRDADYWQQTAAQLAAAAGELRIDGLELNIRASGQEREAENNLPVAEFAALMQAAAGNSEFQAESAKSLNSLINQLPPELRDGLADNKQQSMALLNDILAEGQAHITALLKTQAAAEAEEED